MSKRHNWTTEQEEYLLEQMENLREAYKKNGELESSNAEIIRKDLVSIFFAKFGVRLTEPAMACRISSLTKAKKQPCKESNDLSSAQRAIAAFYRRSLEIMATLAGRLTHSNDQLAKLSDDIKSLTTVMARLNQNLERSIHLQEEQLTAPSPKSGGPYTVS